MTDATDRVYSYFPGCSQQAMNRAYDISTRSVARALGIELAELDDWNCCGATAYLAVDEKRALVLPARDLALAEKTGRADLVTSCNGCYLVLNKTNRFLAEKPELRAEIGKALAAGGMAYEGTVRVQNFLEVVLNDIGEDAVKDRVSNPLAGLKVASYYGCQLSRPFSEIDDAEFPESMDRLAGWLGAEPVFFPMKAKCCGGLMMTTQPAMGRKLTGKILKSAKESGADCIITCCPLCQINLEAFQRQVGDAIGYDCSIPVLYFTQLMGRAFGLDSKALALKDSLTPVEAMLTEKVAST